MREEAGRARRRRTVWGIALAGFALLSACAAKAPSATSNAARAQAPRLGKPLTAEQVAQADITVFPDGRGLPTGRGNAIEGRAVYVARCASCHGAQGRGGSAEELVGGREPLTSTSPDKTIGRYWPYATTLFDFNRRAMPMDAPRSLSADQVYAVTAWLLFAEGIIGERDEMNAATLPAVRMPNRAGFIWVDAPPVGAR